MTTKTLQRKPLQSSTLGSPCQYSVLGPLKGSTRNSGPLPRVLRLQLRVRPEFKETIPLHHLLNVVKFNSPFQQDECLSAIMAVGFRVHSELRHYSTLQVWSCSTKWRSLRC